MGIWLETRMKDQQPTPKLLSTPNLSVTSDAFSLAACIESRKRDAKVVVWRCAPIILTWHETPIGPEQDHYPCVFTFNATREEMFNHGCVQSGLLELFTFSRWTFSGISIWGKIDLTEGPTSDRVLSLLILFEVSTLRIAATLASISSMH